MFGAPEPAPLPPYAHLIPCEVCGHDVSGLARRCPSCGHPLPRQGKSWWIAFLLTLFLGNLGAARLYTGHNAVALAYLLTCGGFTLGTAYDLWHLLTGRLRDGRGRPLQGAPRWAYPGGPVEEGALYVVIGVLVTGALGLMLSSLF